MIENQFDSTVSNPQLIHENCCLRSQIDVLRQKYPKEHDYQFLLENPQNGTLDLHTRRLNGTSFYSLFSFYKIKSLFLLRSPLKSEKDQILDFTFQNFTNQMERTLQMTVNQFTKTGYFIQALLLEGITFPVKLKDSQKESLFKGYILSHCNITIFNVPILPGWNSSTKTHLFILPPFNTIDKFLDGQVKQKKILYSPDLLNNNSNEVVTPSILPFTKNKSLTFLYLIFISSLLQTLFNQYESIYWDKIINICVDNITLDVEKYLKQIFCFYENPKKIPELSLSTKEMTNLIRASKDEVLLLKIRSQNNRPADIHQIENNLNLLLDLNGTEISQSNSTCNTFIPVVLSTTPIAGVSPDNIITLTLDNDIINHYTELTKYTAGDLVIQLTNYISANFNSILHIIETTFKTQYTHDLESYHACYLQMVSANEIIQHIMSNSIESKHYTTIFPKITDLLNWFQKQLATSDCAGITEIFIESFKQKYTYGIFKCITPYEKYPNEDTNIPIIIDERFIYFRRSVFQNKIAPVIFSDVLPLKILKCLADEEILVIDSSAKRCYEVKKRITSAEGACRYERVIVLRKSAFIKTGEANIF